MCLNQQLPRSRILLSTNSTFDIRLMMMTKSKGIDLVLNFLSGELFQAAFRTIAYHGKFFHFSKSDMKTYGNIGKSTLFYRLAFFMGLLKIIILSILESQRNTSIFTEHVVYRCRFKHAVERE